MYISTILPISVLLSLTVAQTTSSSSSSSSSTSSVCAAQPVLDACLASTQAIAAACATTDYNCLCQKYAPIVTCFNQCPNDSRYTGIYNTQQTYCADASVYSSSTTSAASSGTSGASTTTSASGSSGTSTTTSAAVKATSTGTSTASSTASATGNAGVKGAQIAGGLMVAVAGFVGAML